MAIFCPQTFMYVTAHSVRLIASVAAGRQALNGRLLRVWLLRCQDWSCRLRYLVDGLDEEMGHNATRSGRMDLLMLSRLRSECSAYL